MKNKTTLLLLLALFFSLLSSAQDTLPAGSQIDIGIRVNYITYNFQKNTFNSVDVIDQTLKSISPDIVIERIKEGKTFYRIRAGYQKVFATTEWDRSFSTGGWRSYGEQTTFEYRFAAGIGKLHSLEQITFKLGLEATYNLTTPRENNYTIEDIDTSGTVFQTTKLHYNEPEHHAIGLTFISGIGYNFWKSFSANLEITNYFLYAFKKGPITKEYEYYDANGNLTDTTTENDEIDYHGFNTFLLSPSIGISYSF